MKTIIWIIAFCSVTAAQDFKYYSGGWIIGSPATQLYEGKFATYWFKDAEPEKTAVIGDTIAFFLSRYGRDRHCVTAVVIDGIHTQAPDTVVTVAVVRFSPTKGDCIPLTREYFGVQLGQTTVINIEWYVGETVDWYSPHQSPEHDELQITLVKAGRATATVLLKK